MASLERAPSWRVSLKGLGRGAAWRKSVELRRAERASKCVEPTVLKREKTNGLCGFIIRKGFQ